MPNEVVAYYRQFIGQQISDTPSEVAKWLKGTLTNIDEGLIEADFEVRKEMTNPFGSLHGGMASLIIDEIMGGAVFSLANGKQYVTVNLVVDYLSGANENEIIHAKAWVVRNGKSIANCSAEIRNSKGVLIAKATSNLLARN